MFILFFFLNVVQYACSRCVFVFPLSRVCWTKQQCAANPHLPCMESVCALQADIDNIDTDKSLPKLGHRSFFSPLHYHQSWLKSPLRRFRPSAHNKTPSNVGVSNIFILRTNTCAVHLQIGCCSWAPYLISFNSWQDIDIQLATNWLPNENGLVICEPRREAGDVWCLPPVWNLRAVIWFHFAISSLVLLSSPVTLSVLSFSACWPFLLNFFQKILQ